MRYSFNSAAVFLSAITLASAQTFTDCNPTEKKCPADAALSSTLTTDFTKVTGTKAPSGWVYADGTTLSYDSTNGANFAIKTKTGAPTISLTKYIMFGRVTAKVKASGGTGIVSSFILESDDLDEIDWEWLGSTDSSVESNFFGKGNTTTYNRALYHDVTTPIETFHTYVIDWTAERVNWYIDDLNTPVRTLLYSDPVALGGKNYPQTPMLVKMGSWVGCPDDKDPAITGTCQWAGGQAEFPGTYTMYVQSVTVEDYGCGSEYTYGDLSGSWESIVASGDCDGTTVASSAVVSKSTAQTSAKATSTVTKTSAGGVFADVSTTLTSTGAKATDADASSTGSKTSDSASAKTTGTAAHTTLTTGTAAAASSGTQTSTSSSATSSSSTAASSASKKFGTLDYSVMALGLGLGYLVM